MANINTDVPTVVVNVPAQDPYELNDTGFASTGGGAALGNPHFARQGTNAAIQPPSTAPAKASAAPDANTITIFTGLCDALNQFQENLKNSGTYDIADIYSVEFASPPNIGQELVILPGTISYKSTGMASKKNPSSQLNADTNSVQKNSRAIQVQAGTQIVQFLDQVIRNSTFITQQANISIDEKGVATVTPKSSWTSQNSGFMWYKITFNIQCLGPDSKRNDNAYKMTFIINPYPVTDLQSQFFSPGTFRGVHKSYDYWFTGKNSQVLNFEQDYNTMYYQILMSPPEGLQQPGGGTAGSAVPTAPTTASAFNLNDLPTVSKSFQNGTGQSTQGGDNGAAYVGASAADWLYSITNRGSITLKIVGDPAWLQQGEITNTVTAANFSWAPFNADDGINFDASAVMFDIKFNRPGDYNFTTGLVDVTTPSTDPITGAPTLLQPQAHLVYTAKKVTSTFSQGKFEQVLEGKAYLGNFNAAINAAAERKTGSTSSTSPSSTSAGSRQALLDNDGNVTAASIADPNRWGSEPDTSSSPTSTTQDDQSQVSQPNPQPASPASDPTSNGDVSGNSSSPAPQNASTSNPVVANADETAAVNAYVAAGGTFPRGTGPITSGPLFDGVVAAKASLTARQQAASGVSTTSSPPQTMAPPDA